MVDRANTAGAAPAPDLRGRRLLAIFAHPDDESIASGGVLAWSAACGAHVSVLCLTAGEHGPRAGGTQSDESLRQIRAEELQAAANALGVDDVELLDFEDGMLPWIDAPVVEARIVSEIERHRPEVVITFDEDGLYWHPDHIAVHERVTAAVASLGARAPMLYYTSIPPGAMRHLFDHAIEAASAVEGRPPSAILGIADPDAFGSHAPAPTLVVTLGDFAARKLAAVQCHRSQLENDALDRIGPADAAVLLGVEYYRRAPVGAAGDGFIEQFGRYPS